MRLNNPRLDPGTKLEVECTNDKTAPPKYATRPCMIKAKKSPASELTSPKYRKNMTIHKMTCIMRKNHVSYFNFSPGPCALPDAVMEKAQAEFAEYGNIGASIMELSHRGDVFMREYQRAENFLRQLLSVPGDYAILFLQGGATGQAAAIPLNLIDDKNRTAAYAVTGHWSKQAAVEGRKYCAVHIAADTADSGYRTLPKRMDIPDNAVYFHYADNETIHGVEFPSSPSSSAPLVCDMSSNIATRPINISDYGLIYAGRKKTWGLPAFVSLS